MDRINNLPDEIICHMVSFLSAKEADFASVLSKRWRNLFNIISSAEFNDSVSNPTSLSNFLNRVLAMPLSSRIRNFSLKCRKLDLRTQYALVNRCLRNVLKRGVLDLKLSIEAEQGYSLPLEVFTCKTLVKLELGTGFDIDILPENALLPSLKTLILDSVKFYDRCGCAFQKLLSACPVLVELVMREVEWEHWKWSRCVSSPTLERLTISHNLLVDEYELESITFNTPSLTYLDYGDFIPEAYSIVNLDSVVEAKLSIILTVEHNWNGNFIRDDALLTGGPTNLIKGLKNVEILNLSSPETTEWTKLNESVSSAILRKLSISINLTDCEGFDNRKSISFDTPSLLYFNYADLVAEDYPLVNMGKLFEARINLMLTTEDQVKRVRAPNHDLLEGDVVLKFGNAVKLMNGIKNVQKLSLTADTLEVLSLCCESMPVFKNLKMLGIESEEGRGWQAMPVLLRNCPHLETLIIEGLLHYETDKCGDACDCISREDKGHSLTSCPVKMLEIQGFRGTIKEMKMIKHFLVYFPCLKEMKIYVAENGPTDLRFPEVSDLIEQLMEEYNKSSSCNVELLVSDNLSEKWTAEGRIL